MRINVSETGHHDALVEYGENPIIFAGVSGVSYTLFAEGVTQIQDTSTRGHSLTSKYRAVILDEKTKRMVRNGTWYIGPYTNCEILETEARRGQTERKMKGAGVVYE